MVVGATAASIHRSCLSLTKDAKAPPQALEVNTFGKIFLPCFWSGETFLSPRINERLDAGVWEREKNGGREEEDDNENGNAGDHPPPKRRRKHSRILTRQVKQFSA